MEENRYNFLLGAVRSLSMQMAWYIKTKQAFYLEDSVNMEKSPEQVLKTVFGYDSFRPMQREVIQNVLDGRDTLAVMPTGGGKSLCYQIPALLFSGMTVVVSPLIALMQDQVSQLEAYGVPAAVINSSLSWNAYMQTRDEIRQGKIKLLYVSPEGLGTQKIQDLLHSEGLHIDCITIDEAHCVSEWGHDFRPDYLEIAGIREQFPHAVCLALTATATKPVRQDIITHLKMENPQVLVSSFNRPNLSLEVRRKTKAFLQVRDYIMERPDQSGIIYCFSRKLVDDLTQELNDSGIRAINYHAGLSDEQRSENQNAFIQDKVNVIVATLAFGMGINKPDVRYVIHYNMPKSIEQYYQEIGRAGRDGLPGEALLLYTPADAHKIRYFFNEKENPANSERLLQGMLSYCESRTCRRHFLMAYFGEYYNPMSSDAVEASCCCDICAHPAGITQNPQKNSGWESSVESQARIQKKPSAKKPRLQSKPVIHEDDEEGQRIAQELRSWRRKAADEMNVPPYVIFGDKTLFDIAQKKPHSTKELLNCYGIGENKARSFGDSILRIVRG